MIKIVSTQQMRAIEQAANAAGLSYAQMMENAGRAVAQTVRQLLGDNQAGKRVIVLVGRGNNGGDGLVAARLLKQESDIEVVCYLAAMRSDTDAVYVSARDSNVALETVERDQDFHNLAKLVASADVLVDALLGTGVRLPVGGLEREILAATGSALQARRNAKSLGALEWVSSPRPSPGMSPQIVAVDCPSGLDCDTGAVDETTLSANVTVSFAAIKRGCLAFPGADRCGELVSADIGIPSTLPELASINLELVTAKDVASLLPIRSRSGHKGAFGKVVVVAGSRNYVGAASLAGRAAYRVGAGLVEMAVPESIYPILASGFPEAIWLLLPEANGAIASRGEPIAQAAIRECDALVIGPGLGQHKETAGFLRNLFRARHNWQRHPTRHSGHEMFSPSVVIDADALNLLAEIPEWWTLLPKSAVITPHVGEMARLSRLSRESVLAQRMEIASEKAREWDCVVVLKGAHTVISEPAGKTVVLPFATDALAKAGTGDVLTGYIGGLMAQGCASFNAAITGAFIHGLAGKLAGQESSTRSVLASDILRSTSESIVVTEPRT